MELVITEGRVTAEAVPNPEGDPEGERGGYLLKIADLEGSAIRVTVPISNAQAEELSTALLNDIHRNGSDPAAAKLEIVQSLPASLKPNRQTRRHG